MGAFVSLQGIKYRWKRAFGATEYDREREKEREEEENPDKSLSKAIVSSLEVSAVTDLPIYIGVRSTILVYFILAIIFGYLVGTSYDYFSQRKFLSLSADDICEDIPKEVSGDFLADFDGNWEGDRGFDYSKAIYHFHFNRLRANTVEFHKIIDIALASIDVLTASMKTENLATTVLVWMTWVLDSRHINGAESNDIIHFSEDNNAHYFSLTGSVGTVFNQADVYTTSLNNENGRCNITGRARYEKSAALFRITYKSAAEYFANSQCMNILDIRNVGYGSSTPTPDFDIVIDAQTVMVSVAVNLGLITLDLLEEVPFSKGVFSVTTENGSTEFEYGRYFHPRFPNMDTMYCLREKATGTFFSCNIYMSTLNVFPVFNHLGYFSSGHLDYCECDSSYSQDMLNDCNAFSFVTGFIFFNYDFLTVNESGEEDFNYEGMHQSEQDFILFVEKYAPHLSDLNRDAYNISKESAVRGYTADQESRKSIYDFCSEGMSRGCSIMTVTAFSSGTEASISENYYQVPWGHCNDTTTISEAAKQKLYVPPVRLTEVYYECKVSKLEAFVTAVGISSGNALSVKLLFVVLLTALLAGRKTGTRKTGSYRTYGVEEREEALHYFAFSLLSARDGRHLGGSSGGDGGTGGEEESVLRGLSEELSHERRIHRFFPAASTGAGDLSTEQKTPADETDQSADVSAELPGRVSQKIRQKKTAAFQSEMLSNPFYVPSKVDLVK